MSERERFKAVVAVHVLLVRGDELLLLRRANTGYEDGNYSVPAGHLDGGETVTGAAIREAGEEIGVHIAPGDVAFVLVMHRKAESERIDFFVAVESWQGQPENREPDKCDELLWARPGSLPANTVPYVRRAIEGWQGGERYTEFGWD